MITKQVKLAVRRWRLAKVINEVPGVIPEKPDDFDATLHLSSTLLPDAVVSDETVLASLMKAGGHVPKDVRGLWKTEARPWLRSTATGA